MLADDGRLSDIVSLIKRDEERLISIDEVVNTSIPSIHLSGPHKGKNASKFHGRV